MQFPNLPQPARPFSESFSCQRGIREFLVLVRDVIVAKGVGVADQLVDCRHVSHVPTFTQHQHRHDARIWILVGINLPGQFPQRLQIIVTDVIFTFLKNRVAIFLAPIHLTLPLRFVCRLVVFPFNSLNTGSVFSR